MSSALTKTVIPELELLYRGKVRDVYVAEDILVLVATDRISAYDSVLPDGIPGKGKVLTQLSKYWFETVADWMPSHYISTNLDDLPVKLEDSSRVALEGRTMLCRRTEALPVECVVRGYITGSAWKEYQETGKVCGIQLPDGLRANSRLEKPIFTPATKATSGHDINISYEDMEIRVGKELAAKLRDSSLRVYSYASKLTEPSDLVLVDTKFEFGFLHGEMLLIDELLTPDSSRYWDKKTYREGNKPHSLDKQFIRDYLTSIGWNKDPPPPSLSSEVIIATTERYLHAYRMITGKSLTL